MYLKVVYNLAHYFSPLVWSILTHFSIIVILYQEYAPYSFICACIIRLKVNAANVLLFLTRLTGIKLPQNW